MRPSLLVWCAAILLATAAPGEPLQELAAAPASPYPVAVRLVVSPDTLATRTITEGTPGLPGMLGTPVVEVGRQASDVYTVASIRMFLPAGKHPTAELAPVVEESGLDLDREGWFAYVEHEVALRDAATGAEIVRWRVRGEGRVIGLGESSIEHAFAEAASYAARIFETDFERSDAAVAWLAAHGVGRGTRAASLPQLPQRFAPKPPPAVQPRANDLLFAEFGAGAGAGANWASTALAARAGWSGQPWFLALALDALPREFVGQPDAAWGEARARALLLSTGVDAGIQKRLGSHFDVSAGVGVALLTGFASLKYQPLDNPSTRIEASDTAFAGAANVFAAVRFNSVFPATTFRYRLGVEVRKSFATAMHFSGFNGSVDPSSFSASFFLGFELPWRGGSRR
jgi:hypothetical protein